MNGNRIDANHLASSYGKNKAAKLFVNAINKTEAQNLYAGAGVQFPGGSLQGGLNRSIFDAGSLVNKNYVEQTKTRQFGRWFGGR